MAEVARRLDYTYSQLYKHFGPLCRAISARYVADRKERRAVQRQQIRDEIRQATSQLHGQGVYPSYDQVQARLSKPWSMRFPGMLAVWHEAVRELG